MNPEDVIGGKYRLDSVVAEGGMAVVWRATDMHLRREVAVKMLKPSIADDEVQAERFRREAIALAQLHHPHIMPVYDCINEDGRVALVMQLINGQSLRDLLDKDRAANGGKASTLSVHTTVHIGRAIASALGAVHAAGIVHRDIKPGNIMMMRSGEIWLTDFGIAKGVKSDQDDNTDLTRPDLMMGTAKYLSPEQVQGRELDGRADIYSLGLVLYECLAGHAPFKGENEQQVAIARLQRDPTPLAGIRHDVPSTVIDVIHKMLRRKPENRYQTADEVVTALAEAMRTVHDSVTPPDGLNGAERQRTKRNDPLDPLMKRRVEEARRRAEAGNAGGDTTPGNGISATADDDTPTSTKKTRSAALPKRQRTRTARNMVPVVTVFVIAAVMAMLLWNGLRDTRSSVPAGTDPGQAPIATVTLNGVRSYDPNGDDGNENEAQVPWLLDGNPATAWTTVCYGDRYFGSKGGLGLVPVVAVRVVAAHAVQCHGGDRCLPRVSAGGNRRARVPQAVP
ncbi:MAG: serine/threonine-protein kinase, partial [Actinomycetota bacterium]